MDCCYGPGTIVVLPRSGGGRELRSLLLGMGERDIDIAYTVEDILAHYQEQHEEILPSREERHRGKAFAAFPFLARVPVGQELAESQRLQRLPPVAVAVPNFYTRPVTAAGFGAFELNESVVGTAVEQLQAQPGATFCGSGVRVAILDTGVDPNLFPFGNLHPSQYDADRPRDPASGWRPYDRVGHGTVVAALIERVAPGARLFSVKVMEDTGDLMAAIAGLYLAAAKVQPHIYNLSLAIRCEMERCAKCRHLKRNPNLLWQVGQLFTSFNRQGAAGHDPLLVAAAGNGSDEVLVPARFPQVLAVGAFDLTVGDLAAYCRYREIPQRRFILAPGGVDGDQGCVARKWTGEFGPKRFYGTSFAAPLVTGIAARYLCTRPECPAGLLLGHSVLDCLSAAADRGFPGYSLARHGVGLARYDPRVGHTLAATPAGPVVPRLRLATPTAAFTAAELHDAVRRRAYEIWEHEDRLPGAAVQHWLTAKRDLGVPDEMEV
jgi:hypothetical protein